MTGGGRGAGDTFFCDTAVLVAAADLRHAHHAASVAVVRTASRTRAFCSAHSVAELYATVTSPAYRDRLRPADVADILKQVRALFTAVALTAAEYFATVEDALARGLRSGQIYDALHLAAAAKVDAATIYTWNLKHFQALAPARIADRIKTP
ncbi:MAG: PIN domain-containing protein [Gemmatimonadetes bacterium]|nr:PIN domain-containing protein [Gemmatimonadota bacterium]